VLQQQADELDTVMDALQRAAGQRFNISKVTALLIETTSTLRSPCLLLSSAAIRLVRRRPRAADAAWPCWALPLWRQAHSRAPAQLLLA
jgi:hypothetical protein